jgi:hypothetical protein
MEIGAGKTPPVDAARRQKLLDASEEGWDIEPS